MREGISADLVACRKTIKDGGRKYEAAIAKLSYILSIANCGQWVLPLGFHTHKTGGRGIDQLRF